jgi:hypothetical protein
LRVVDQTEAWFGKTSQTLLAKLQDHRRISGCLVVETGNKIVIHDMDLHASHSLLRTQDGRNLDVSVQSDAEILMFSWTIDNIVCETKSREL